MPRIVDRTTKKSDLVHAALVVFAEFGFHRATMQQVADRAGVSKGAVYQYFDSKEDLFVSSADTLMRAMFEPALQTLESGPGEVHRRLSDFVAQVLAGVESWNSLCVSVAQVWAELGAKEESPLRVLMRDQYLASVGRIAKVFAAAIARGEVPPFDTRQAALALIAVLDGALLQTMILSDAALRDLATDRFRAWCCALIPAEQAQGRSRSC